MNLHLLLGIGTDTKNSIRLEIFTKLTLLQIQCLCTKSLLSYEHTQLGILLIDYLLAKFQAECAQCNTIRLSEAGRMVEYIGKVSYH